MIEAHAAVKALEVASHLGFPHILFEGDALEIIKQLQLREFDSNIGNIMEEEIGRAHV